MSSFANAGTGAPGANESPFAAPWEALVFALVCALQETGKLSAADWSGILGAEIRAAAERGSPDLGDRYYMHCLAALDKWLRQTNLAGEDEIDARIADWRAAYLTTPHGEPVELS